MKNLENYGVQELNAKEIRETDGGFFGVVLAIIATAIAVEIAMNPSASWDALMEGWNSVPNVE